MVISGREVIYLEQKDALTIERSILETSNISRKVNRKRGRSSLFNWLLEDDLLTVSKILKVINQSEEKS